MNHAGTARAAQPGEAILRSNRYGFRSGATLDDSPEAIDEVRRVVARAREGNRDAVRFLYLQYSDNVYGYVRSIVRDDHEAEDVTQHVFARLMTVLVKYDDRGAPFFAWLLRLARNAAIDHLRTLRSIPTEEILGADASHDEEAAERARCLHAALASLPEDQRSVVILRHVAGLSPPEIAERMGRTESSIHGLHHRGRRTLREALVGFEVAPCTSVLRPAIRAC